MHKRRYLQADEKLAVLRANDPFRKWRSLDDKRHCFLCERIITGRQIEVKHTSSGYELRCPTEGCQSSPHEWVYPGNPYVSEESWHDYERVIQPVVSDRNGNLSLSGT